MAFTASEFPDVLARLDTLLPGDNSSKAEMKYPTPLLEAITQRQQVADLNQFVNKDTGSCETIRAWFYEIGAHLQQETVPTGAAQGCGLIDGSEGATRSKDYNVDRVAMASFKIIGPKCNNAVDRNIEMARLMAKAMSDMRKNVQKRTYTLLAANAQANQSSYDSTASGGIFGSVAAGGNRVSIDPNNFNFETLRKIDILADENLFPSDYLILDGRNFYLDHDLAMFRSNNDNQRDQAAVFGDSEIFHDKRSLEAQVGRRSTFLLNPYQFLFFNDAWYPEEGEEWINDSKHYVRTTVEDPLWSYNLNGVLTPVRYHMEVETTCSSRNSRGDVVRQILVNLSLPGVLDLGPTGMNNPVDGTTAPASVITGVMELTAETPD